MQVCRKYELFWQHLCGTVSELFSEEVQHYSRTIAEVLQKHPKTEQIMYNSSKTT